MHRSFVACWTAIFACALLGAAPGAFLAAPVLVVYPLTAGGSALDKDAGSKLALALATQVANLGGVVVKVAPAGTERRNYLDAARAQSADYYLAGYITPLGDAVAMVEQLVSVQSGIVVFSNTAQIQTYADAAGQGDIIRSALLRHQTRNIGSYAAPPPPAAGPTPAAAASGGPEANLGGLFKRKRGHSSAAAASSFASPVPSASVPAASAAPATGATAAATVAVAPVPAATAPHTAYAVLPIGGSADAERRTFAQTALVNALTANKAALATAADPTPAALCAAGAAALLDGMLAARSESVLGQPQTSASFELLVHDCAGRLTYHRTFERDAGGDWKNAVERAVEAAVGAYLHPPAKRRRRG